MAYNTFESPVVHVGLKKATSACVGGRSPAGLPGQSPASRNLTVAATGQGMLPGQNWTGLYLIMSLEMQKDHPKGTPASFQS